LGVSIGTSHQPQPSRCAKGSKYIVERNLLLESFKEDTLIIEGLAEEASRAFPATSNAAVSLRLAIAPVTSVPVRVRIIAVPVGNENVHEIRLPGEFGRIAVKIKNAASSVNRRTSQLAAFSAIAILKNLTRSLSAGT
jgi:aspartate dehydrogenase